MIPVLFIFQEESTSIVAVAQGDLPGALRACESALKDAPDNLLHHHTRGILLTALGRMAEAEGAFTRVIDSPTQMRPTPTGLEPFMVRGHPLYEALNRQKTQIAVEGGIAAARNNRGAVRLLLRKTDAATEDIDQAAVLASDWGVPWGNGALVWLERGEPARALENARKATDLGEQSAWALAVLAEAERQTGQLSRAEEHLNQGAERDATHPYLLAVRASVAQQQAKAREAERALAQALALSPETAAASRYVPAAGNAFGIVGNINEQHLNLLAQGLPGQTAYRVTARGVRQRIEGRNNGDQSFTFAEVIYGRRGGGTVLASFQDESGGRPGAATSRAGVDTEPNLRFQFQRESLRYQTQISPTKGGRFLLLAGMTRSQAAVRPAPSQPNLRVLDENALQAEVRWESSGTEAGVAWARIKRGGASFGPFITSSPIEPSEQVLTNGTKQIGLAYALRRHTLSPHIVLTAGGVVGTTNGKSTLQPLADLAVTVIGRDATHLRIRPRVSEAATGLFPLSFLAEAPQSNSIDRREGTTHDFNRTPTLTGENGRFLSSELSLPPIGAKALPLELTLFQHRLNNAYTQATDARLAPGLALTPIPTGEARGVRAGTRVSLSKTASLRFQMTYQQTKATITGATYDERQYPVQVPQDVRTLPNFPRWQAGVLVEGTLHGWQMGLEGAFLGRRTGAFTVKEGGSGELATYVSSVAPAIGAHLHLVRSFGDLGSFRLTLFNLGKSNFYPGYPSRLTAVAGWDFRF